MKINELLPPHLQGKPFTRQAGLRAGIPLSAFRERHLRKHFHGVYSAPDLPVTKELRAEAALLAVRGPAMIAGISALRLLDVPMPLGRRDDGTIHVLRAHALSHRGPKGIAVTNSRRTHPAMRHPQHRRIVMSEPVDAWLQEAEAGASIYDLVVLGDGLVRRQRPLATMAALTSAVDQAGAIDGAANLRSALSLIREGTDSAMETHARLLIVVSGLPEPAVNPTVYLTSLDDDRHPDMGYQVWLVSVEYQGDDHRARFQWRMDESRRLAFETDGWIVIYLTGAVIARPTQFLKAIESAILSRGWDGVRLPPPITAAKLGLPGAPLSWPVAA